MPQDASCPKCNASFPVTEARHPFTVACPKCDAEMTVEFKKPAAAPEAGQPHYELAVKPGALASTMVPPPPVKKKKNEDDDEDEPKRKGGSAMVVFLSGWFGMLAVLGGLGLTAWVLFGYIGRETAANTTTNRPNQPNNNPRLNPPNIQPNNPRPNVPGQNTPGPDPWNPPKPKDTFDLRPVTGPLPAITPLNLSGDTGNIDLVAQVGPNAKVGSVAVGGGGRYIVMHFPEAGKLSVFDVSTATLATVEADRGELYLTAGLSKVVTCVAGGGIFRIYNLPDLAKQYDSSGPGSVHGMAMGSRTNGPLLTVLWPGEVKLWDIGDSAMKEVEGASGRPQPGIHWREHGLRASPDGTAFSTHDDFGSNQKTTLLTVANRKWKVQPDVAAAPFPSVDGHFFGNGTVINKAGQMQQYGGVGASSGTWFLPSVSNKDYFLKIAPVTTGTGVRQKKTLAVSVHKGKNSDAPTIGTTVLTGEVDFDKLTDGFRNEPAVAYDQHFFLVPEAKLLVTLNGDKNRLVLRKLNIK